MKKRFLAMALCLAMTLSLFPTGVFANPENEPAAPSSEAVAELVQEQPTEALPEAAAETEKTENEAPAVPVMAEAEIAAEAEKADGEALAEPEKAESEASNEPAKADSEALAEPEMAESEASSEPAKADSEPAEPEAETAKEPAEENSGSKWDALKNSIANLFGGAVEPANIVPDLTVDTYEFYVDGEIQKNWTQRVAEGDTLKIPGTPKKDGYVFLGWFHGETEVNGGEITKVSGTTVHVDAKFQAASYVHFVGTDGTTVVHTVQGTSGEAVSKADISTAAEMVRLTLGSEQSVQGWSETQGDSTPLENIAFAEGTRTLYPVVKTGYWVTFNSDGGSYIAPQFSNAGEPMNLSQFVPTKAGYDFVGWYLDGKPVTAVSAAATVTASWQAKDAQYTVIYWQENADDDEYSFAESETKTGTAGTKAEPSKKSYEGFTLNTEKSETKTIAGDGSTILNVYYKRNVYEVNFYSNNIICGKEEHTHNWWCRTFGCSKQEHTHTNDCRELVHSIKAKMDANISDKWPGGTWSVNANVSDGPWQANIDTMPLNGANFYGPKTGYGSETAYYFVEVLPGESGEKASDGRVYKLHHKDTSPGGGYSATKVTKEDQYPITGFTLVERISTRIGASYDGAKFYYSRNSYDINFYSGKTFVHNISRKFQQSIADVSYKPSKPDNIPANYQFAGWYANELCEGDAFQFEGTMPANNITLYAKWAAPQITVTIPQKDGSNRTITVPYGSKLEDSADWKKLAEELKPDAWMNGDKIFNLNTELYENITLTPYYRNDATPCTITYDENGTTWPDTTKYAKGGMATIRNPKHSEGLKFQCWKLDENTTLLPGQSITVTGDVTLTAVYGEPLEHKLTLTYHNGNNTRVFENLPANSEQTAKNPADLGQGFETPEGKQFAGWAITANGTVEYAAGAKFYITINGSNDLYAIWVEKPNISDENVASINDPTDAPYDGTEHKWTPEVKDKEGNALIENTDYTVSYDKNDFTNVGTIKVTITGIGNYTGTVERTYQITKRSVTLTSETASKPYDGTPLTKPDVTVTGDGFVAGEVSEIKATGSVTYVSEGEVTNTITYTEGANFKESNYDITKTEGKLSITAQPISSNGIIVEKLSDVLYDGEKHEQKPVVKDGETTLTEGEHYTLHYDGDTTNAGTVTVVVFGKGNYNGETSVSYKITPRKVTLTSETASKPYDGTPLTRPNVKVEGDGFVAGEVEENSIRATGSVLNVGDNGKNAIEFTTTDAFKYTNYAITKNEGTLTITGQSIVPDPDNPDSYRGITISDPTDALYDGTEHKWTPEVKDKNGNALTENTDYTVAYNITQKATPDYRDYTDVCTIDVTITGKGNYSGSVTKTYRITPRKVTLTSETASKPYDGTPLTKPEVTVKGDGFVAGEAYKILAHGTVTEVKDSPVVNEISYKVTENYKGDNYIVTYERGKLSITGQSIVPDPDNPESYKGIAISDPTDVTYDGKEHKWAPEVKDKEGNALTENTDYAVSYDKDDFTNVGEIKVTITGIGNYTGKVEKSYKILPATLTVTTNSAEKTHDGNRLTADGTIKGFVNGETATFMITGSQTDVGSSTNTYKIEWNGTAKQSNYTVVEKLGTLKVNERSGGGGGSSSTPTPAPEQTPTPTPAPVIVPPAPAPAPTPAPARRITPAATATPTPAPTAKPTETKQPEPEPEVIEDEETPLAPMPTGAWALVNLILMLLTVLASLLLLIGYLGKKKHTERDEYGNKRTDYTRNKKGFWRVASLIPAIAAVIAFVLTENMKLPMIMVDRWTLLMAVIAVLQLIVAVMSKKQKESQDDENEANA